MIIIGAQGFAKEVLEVVNQLNIIEKLAFYDDVNKDLRGNLYNKFPILKTTDEVLNYFETIDNRFTIGIGNPVLRKNIHDKFVALGGVFTSTISPLANIGNFGNLIDVGCNIMTGTIITSDVVIKKGCLINLNCTIGHDSVLGEFVETSPGAAVSGNCTLGDYSVLGTNSTILPKINIGKNVIVGAGAVVTKDIPDNCVVVGAPAKIIKDLEPLRF